MMRRFILTTASLFLLSACGDATATNEQTPEPETKAVTRSECLAMKVKEDKIACFKKLTEQERVKQTQIQKDIDVLKAENERRRQRNEKLLREFEKDVLNED